jgi:carbonic anhydrase/acetyltransferase-like protein (isoleucine patch superfamily)
VPFQFTYSYVSCRHRSQIAPTAIVAKEAKLTGKVTVGSGAIIHPDATIHAAPGFEVTIGENCLIEERASILAQYDFAVFFPRI